MAVTRFSTSRIGNNLPKGTKMWDGTSVAVPPYTYSSTQPIAWYSADDLTSITTGTVWPNRVTSFAPALTSTASTGSVLSSWRSGRKAVAGQYDFKADMAGSVLNQQGPFTMLTVSFTNQSGFGPYFGIGEWWGNYSSVYSGYYYHGLYSTNWGNFTATPAVVGMRKASGSNFLDTYSNGSFGGDNPGGSTPNSPSYLTFSGSADGTADGTAEILVWNSTLSNAEMNTVKDALRTKYSF